MSFSKSMLPWCAASLGLAALACGGDGPLEPLEPDPPTPAVIASVSGDGQQGKAGEKLGEPFVVRVTDAQGDGVPGLQVTWRVVSGAGDLGRGLDGKPLFTRTDRIGSARVSFRPIALGASTVTAEVAGLQDSRVTFTADAAGVVIHFYNDLFEGAAWFAGPEGPSDVTVPVGTTVEWAVGWAGSGGTTTARIASGSPPPGGEPFDSGDLTYPARFSFVAAVAGTWEFEDRISGAIGTLTAR